jgi:signal transduction histidine kinase
VTVQATVQATAAPVEPLRVLLVDPGAADTALPGGVPAGPLGALAHCQLSSVRSLSEAVAYLQDEQTDLALLVLPLSGAFDVEPVTTLARRFPTLPILVLAPGCDEETAVLALHAGAQDVLTAPAADPQLARSMRFAVERKQAELIRCDRDAAESANRAKSAFLSQMSHELRTPLTAILGFAQLLELQADTQEQELVRPIMRAGRQLQRLIEEILDIARIDAGELSLSLEPVRVDEVLDEAIGVIAPLAEARGITVDADLAPLDGVHVFADRQRISQVFLNLLSNAVKYDRDGGRTRIRCIPTGGRLRIDVTNTGLGLVITKRLTEAMGGSIGLTSTPGSGTTAWTEWTVVPDPALADPPTAGDPAAQLRGTVLYIEDNFTNVTLVQALLARQPGVRLMSVMKARLGLELAQQHRPDVILMDLHLPDMSGEEALAQLRVLPSIQDIPVVVISADATSGTRERIVARGARAFLAKPFDVEELLDVLSEAIASR